MNLFFREVGEGSPIVILHGLFGSSDNWLSIARALSENHKVFSIDQRNHGQSSHSEEWDYEVMANDLKSFIELHDLNHPIVMGHSMGGKTAMRFAVENPDMLDKLVVVDIAPKDYPVHHDVILEGLNSIDLASLKTRGEADLQLSKYVPDVGTRQFLLKNLARTPDGFRWKINLPVIESKIEQIGIGLAQADRFEKPTLFIRGANSKYIKDEDAKSLNHHFPNSSLETIHDAGHWVHAEQPERFLEIVTKFIE